VKTITIEPGKRLFDVHAVFTKNGKVAADLPVCIGITTHDGKAVASSNPEQGWVACWEEIEGSDLGTGAMMDPEQIVEIKEVKSEEKDQSHIFIITKTNAEGAVDYKAGYGWEKAGVITTTEEWSNYLNKVEI
jgi:hypothetical protein